MKYDKMAGVGANYAYGYRGRKFGRERDQRAHRGPATSLVGNGKTETTFLPVSQGKTKASHWKNHHRCAGDLAGADVR